jgi:hypothetical protein
VTVLPLPPLPPMRFLAAACCFLLRSSHSHTDGSYERQGTSWRAGDGRFDDGSATTGGGDDRDDSDDCGTVPLSCRPDCAAAIVAAAHACSTRGGGALQLVAGVYHLNPANDTGKGLGLSGTISSRVLTRLATLRRHCQYCCKALEETHSILPRHANESAQETLSNPSHGQGLFGCAGSPTSPSWGQWRAAASRLQLPIPPRPLC